MGNEHLLRAGEEMRMCVHVRMYCMCKKGNREGEIWSANLKLAHRLHCLLQY